MALAVVYTRAKTGINAPLVTVEVHLSNGLPSLSIVGLPETAVKESKDRVRSAILNSHFEFPTRRITINLAPADLPKEGGQFDLAIALGILAASGQIPLSGVEGYEFLGELALSGELRQVVGVLPATLACGAAQRKLILPFDNAAEAALTQKTDSYPAKHLLEVCAHVHGNAYLEKSQPAIIASSEVNCGDLSDVMGQHQAKRALEIAAAGNHNLLFEGPPGTGKTMLASRLPSIMPLLTEEIALQVTAIHSIAGYGLRANLFERPFRSPHHTASPTALVGGGSNPKPGEISLAHGGVLFLDELPEFPRQALEILREPLESGEITISRARSQVCYPASFQLLAAMNPCPCGYFGEQRCCCSPAQIQRYRMKISGPLLDRIDLQVQVSALPKGALTKTATAAPQTSSRDIRTRVQRAVTAQLARQNKVNARLNSNDIAQYCQLTTEQQRWLDSAIDTLKLSARGYHRVLKVARTIADLDNSPRLKDKHISEAVGYRLKTQ